MSMIVYRIHGNFFIVLLIQLKTCRSNGLFLFLNKTFWAHLRGFFHPNVLDQHQGQWHIKGLVWVYHFFTKWKLKESWGSGSLGYIGKAPRKKFHVYTQRVLNTLECPLGRYLQASKWFGNIKVSNDV